MRLICDALTDCTPDNTWQVDGNVYAKVWHSFDILSILDSSDSSFFSTIFSVVVYSSYCLRTHIFYSFWRMLAPKHDRLLRSLNKLIADNNLIDLTVCKLHYRYQKKKHLHGALRMI